MHKLSIFKEKRPSVAVWKFTSCDGCQLTLLDCEDEILSVADIVEFKNFIEISSDVRPGPYDISIVEGSISTPREKEMIQRVREESTIVICIGACATTGGIQALRNFASIESYKGLVYARPDYINTLATSTAIAEHIKVDYELHGCPINKRQLLDVILSFIIGKRPSAEGQSVCMECKAKGNVCLSVASKTACLGPVTHAGCGALCPTYGRGCYGCYGPKEMAEPVFLTSHFEKAFGTSQEEIKALLSNFTCAAKEFKKAREHYDRAE